MIRREKDGYLNNIPILITVWTKLITWARNKNQVILSNVSSVFQNHRIDISMVTKPTTIEADRKIRDILLKLLILISCSFIKKRPVIPSKAVEAITMAWARCIG